MAKGKGPVQFRRRAGALHLAASGAAVLVISQDLDEAMAMADRLAVMHGGHLSAARPVSALSRAEIGLLMTEGEDKPATRREPVA